jgi:hypothetical protein
LVHGLDSLHLPYFAARGEMFGLRESLPVRETLPTSGWIFA